MSRLALCDVSGPLKDLLEKLSGGNGGLWSERLKKMLRCEELLQKLASVQLAAVARFVADEETRKAANNGWFGENFKKFFAKKVEENVSACIVAVHRLEKSSLDAPILTKLGDRAEISLAHLFELIKKQSKGEAGQLLVNGCANVAYIRGTDGNLWAVYACWFSHYGFWLVGAFSVESPDRWRDGVQILSRDS